tara:strand:+ start:3732 stop:4175 length:444 start_codon:yes stop_codon:yes gene_type:complete
MEYIVFFAAILVLIGSISMAMPSKSSRKISKIRMEAKLLGCKISSTLYGKNKFQNHSSYTTSYQIKNETNLRDAHFIRDKKQLILYSPVKLKYSESFETIKKQLGDASDSLIEVIFTNSSILFLWNEISGIEDLKIILSKLKEINYF